MGKYTDRLAHAWNAFTSQDEDYRIHSDAGASYGGRPDRSRLTYASDKSIISSIYTRLSIDVAAVAMRHIKTDKDGRFLTNVDSGLNYCLTQEANLDQAARAFRQDIAMTMFDKGVVAIVAVDTTLNPEVGAYDIKTLRVGQISMWMPDRVRVSLYNEKTGRKEEVTVNKKYCAIIENPLYAVMNEPNSTLQRLIRKLSLLDSVDEQVSSGKLDLIIQLPYVVKSEARRQQAETRRKDIEMQMTGSKYGIAYTDGTEKITQLNRPAENNMLAQVEYLTGMLYGQLGLTEAVFNGTADEKTMLNYYNRTVEPVLTAITESMKRSFLTKTARTQGQTIEIFRDPFKLVSVGDLAEIADKMTRNEILSSNEVRSILGLTPVNDPRADALVNKNIPEPEPPPSEVPQPEPPPPEVQAT